MKSIILMGIKHCGKSTQGKLLSQKYSCKFYDIDTLIEEENGKTPREIYNQCGEVAFIQAEKIACRNLVGLLESNNSSAVIATGGGICNNPEALAELKKIGNFVFLCADEKVAADRIVREIHKTDDGKMEGLPAYIAKKNPESIEDVRKIFHEFYVARSEIYSKLCDVQVNMSDAPKDENTQQIMDAIEKLE